jgi:hypothetical protein
MRSQQLTQYVEFFRIDSHKADVTSQVFAFIESSNIYQGSIYPKEFKALPEILHIFMRTWWSYASEECRTRERRAVWRICGLQHLQFPVVHLKVKQPCGSYKVQRTSLCTCSAPLVSDDDVGLKNMTVRTIILLEKTGWLLRHRPRRACKWVLNSV